MVCFSPEMIGIYKAYVSRGSPSLEETDELWGNRSLSSGVLTYASRKVKSCYWLEFVAYNIPTFVDQNQFL